MTTFRWPFSPLHAADHAPQEISEPPRLKLSTLYIAPCGSCKNWWLRPTDRHTFLTLCASCGLLRFGHPETFDLIRFARPGTPSPPPARRSCGALPQPTPTVIVPLPSKCWCGEDGADYGQYGESMGCTTPCPGDGDEYCGGSWSMNVYRVGDHTPEPTPAPTPNAPTSNTPFHLGCFEDAHPRHGGTRIFSKEALTSEDAMSSSVSKLERFSRRGYGSKDKEKTSGARGRRAC